MKRTAKLIALLLAVCTLLALAACGGTASKSSAASELAPAPDAAATPKTEPQPDAPLAPETEPEPEPEGGPVTYELPLTTEDITYSWFIMNNALVGQYPQHDEWNANDTVRYLSEITGVNIDMVGVTDPSTQFSIMLAGDDYPDILSGFGTYFKGGYDSAIADDVILDLSGQLDKMPNYKAYLEQYPELYSQAHTDSGALWGCARFSIDEAASNGFVIRKDWLDAQKLALPETLTELENVLTVFQTEYDTANGPLLMYNHGNMSGFGFAYSFNNSFDVGIVGTFEGSPFINKDGTVVFTPATEEWRNYLEVCSDWYKKGLIYQDFPAVGLMDMEPAFVQGKVAVIEAGYLTMGTLQQKAEGSEVVGMKYPINDINGRNGELHLGPHTNTVDSQYSVCVSAKAEELDTLLKFFDYLYTEEGRVTASYGLEGTTYEKGPDGKPAFTEFVTNNPDGFSVDVVRVAFCFKQAPIMWDWTLEESMSTYSQAQYDARRLWDAYDDAWNLPPVTLTADESYNVQDAYMSLTTYVSEYDLKVISGELTLEDSWEEYLATLESMDYKSVTEAYQAALERYLAR